MAGPARRNLERIVLLGRGLAVLLGLVLGGQVYARGGGAVAGTLVGFGACAVAYALMLLLVRRHGRLVDTIERDEPVLPPPRPRSPGRSRRVLTGSDPRER